MSKSISLENLTEYDGLIKDYIDDGLGEKQNTLTFDSTPTQNSTNPVTSNGIYEALQNAGGGGITELVGTSSNPINVRQWREPGLYSVTGDVTGFPFSWNNMSEGGFSITLTKPAFFLIQGCTNNMNYKYTIYLFGFLDYNTSYNLYKMKSFIAHSYWTSASGNSVAWNFISLTPSGEYKTLPSMTGIYTALSCTGGKNIYNELLGYIADSASNASLSRLTTTDKTSLVNAINEINSGGGSSTDVQINGTSIVSSGTANILTNTAYDSSTNKIATMSDIPSVSGKEDTTNKVTSLSSSSTDTQYPSAKCVYDTVENLEEKVDVVTSSTSTYTIASLTGNKSYKLGEITSLTITATTTFDEETVIYFDSGSTGTSISIPDSLTNLGDVPTLTTASNVSTGTCDTNKSYIVAVLNDIAVWRKY